MSRLLLASGNQAKLAELDRILRPLVPDLDLIGLADLSARHRYPEPAETGRTFMQNAEIKARAGVAATGIATIADDSGLCVDELNGMPGVRSARWAGAICSSEGRQAQDDANNALLLAQLADLTGDLESRRSAHFECAVVACIPRSDPSSDSDPIITMRACGTMPGRIARRRAGGGGFGYDVIFVPDGLDVTSAELSSADKDARSHRGQALRAIATDLARALGSRALG